MILTWYSTFFNKNSEYKRLKNDKTKIQPNIYENNIKLKDHAKKFHVIHYVFKYKFLLPLIFLGNKILGKYIIKKIPKESHNRNLIILDKAYEEAIRKWHIYYLRNNGDPATRKSEKYWVMKAKQEKILHSIKNYLITMYLYDTAYREFVNILSHEVARGMADEYSKAPYTGKTGHLFFSTDMYDVNYFILEKRIRYVPELSIQDASKLLQDYYLYRGKQNETKI